MSSNKSSQSGKLSSRGRTTNSSGEAFLIAEDMAQLVSLAGVDDQISDELYEEEIAAAPLQGIEEEDIESHASNNSRTASIRAFAKSMDQDVNTARSTRVVSISSRSGRKNVSSIRQADEELSLLEAGNYQSLAMSSRSGDRSHRSHSPALSSGRVSSLARSVRKVVASISNVSHLIYLLYC
jgi:hypothetical protein